jgi:FtsZ-binding cell division protein ZapB
MFGYLEKFKQLPKELQMTVSSPEAMRLIGELEKSYGVELASVVIKVVVKEIPWMSLVEFLTAEHHLPRARAEELQQELADKIFMSVKRYLGIEEQNAELKIKNYELRITKSEVKNQNSEFRNKNEELKNQKSEIRNNPVISDDFIAAITPEAISLAGIGAQAEQKIKLQNILKTFSKGIRDFISARDALTKEPVNGGLGLARAQAEAILNLAKKQKEKPEASPVAPKSAPLDYLEKTRDIEYNFAKLTKQTPEAEPAAKEKTAKIPESDLKQEIASLSKEIIKPEGDELKLAPPPPIIRSERPVARDEEKVQISKILNQQQPKKGQNYEQAPKTANGMVQMQRPESRIEPDRLKMNDITKPLTRLQGPIEELANLDLINFRRLGGSPEVIIGKIQNKIKLLEQESFTRRQQGVNAWRQSPVYEMYVKIGRESLTGGKPMAEILQVQKGGLTNEEFNAILELNRQLRV